MSLALPKVLGSATCQTTQHPKSLRSAGTFKALAAHVLWRGTPPDKFVELVPFESKTYGHQGHTFMALTAHLRRNLSLSAKFDPTGQLVELTWDDSTRRQRSATPIYSAEGPHTLIDGLRLLRVRDLIAVRMKEASRFGLGTLPVRPNNTPVGTVPSFLVTAYQARQHLLSAVDYAGTEAPAIRNSWEFAPATCMAPGTDPSVNLHSFVLTAPKWSTIDHQSPGITLELSNGNNQVRFNFRLDGVLRSVHFVLGGGRHPPVYFSESATLAQVIYYEDLANLALERVSKVPAVQVRLTTGKPIA